MSWGQRGQIRREIDSTQKTASNLPPTRAMPHQGTG